MQNVAAQPLDTADAAAEQSLLDRAETRFCTHGYDGVSLCELTRPAGTNLAPVNHHFGSKEKLFEEVVFRRVRPLENSKGSAVFSKTPDSIE